MVEALETRMEDRMTIKTTLGATALLVGLALCTSPARAQGVPPQSGSAQANSTAQLQPFIAAQQRAFLQALGQAQQRALGQGGLGQGGFGQGGNQMGLGGQTGYGGFGSGGKGPGRMGLSGG